MPVQPPFSGASDLSTRYGPADGGAAGDHEITVPGNFTKCKNEILALHGRVSNLEGAVGSGGAVQERGARATANSHFQRKRRAFTDFVAATPLATRVNVNRNAYVGPTYAGGVVAAGFGAHYTYAQALASGWMLATQAFSDLGQPISADRQCGLRLSFRTPTGGFYSTMQGNVGAGYVVAGAGDLPGMYQVLTRHMPVEHLRGKELHIRLKYTHTAAIPTGAVFSLFVSWYDGIRRYDAFSAPLVQATSAAEVTLSTSSVSGVFPSGLVPQTATAVEVGIVLSAATGPVFSGDVWDVEYLLVDVGRPGADFAPTAYALDYATAAMHYAQDLIDVTGEDYGGNAHPLIAAGAVTPTALQAPVFIKRYPWHLTVPWKRAESALAVGCRVTEVLAAVANSAGYTPQLAGGGFETMSIGLANPLIPAPTAPWAERGLVTSLDRSIIVTVNSNSSVMLTNVAVPGLAWFGEVFCALSPVGY